MNSITIALQTALALIEAVLTEFGVTPSSLVDKIITGLQQIIPALVGEAAALLPVAQNIINVAKGSGALTHEQLTALQTLDAQADAAFEAAATAAGAPPSSPANGSETPSAPPASAPAPTTPAA